ADRRRAQAAARPEWQARRRRPPCQRRSKKRLKVRRYRKGDRWACLWPKMRDKLPATAPHAPVSPACITCARRRGHAMFTAIVEEGRMNQFPLLSLAVAALALAACATPQQGSPDVTAAPVPELPPAFRAQEIVGRWGLAAYH